MKKVGMGDPKGAGVLTTRRRYSRIEYRQTNVFSDPRGTSYPPSNIKWFYIMTKKENISYQRQISDITDGLMIYAYRTALGEVDRIHRDILLSLREKIDAWFAEHDGSNVEL